MLGLSMNIWDEIIENWSKYVQEEPAKQRALNGLYMLKEILPDMERSHLLTSNCQNLAPWNGSHILETAKIIYSFRNDPKFNLILSRLMSNFSYNDTLIELEIKYHLKNKFQTIFDVKVGDRSECDAVIKVGDELIYCEITNLGWSQANTRLLRLFNELSNFVHFEHRFNWRIKVYDFGSDEDFKKVKNILIDKTEEFNKVNYENNHLLINKEKIEVKEGKIDGSLTGPPFIDDHLQQLQKKISSKIIQSSGHHPSIFIINISSPVRHFDRTHLEVYIKFLEGFISHNHPSLNGILLVNRWMAFSDQNTKPKKEKISSSYSIKSTVNDGLISCYTYLIINKNARINLTEKQIIELKDIFLE